MIARDKALLSHPQRPCAWMQSWHAARRPCARMQLACRELDWEMRCARENRCILEITCHVITREEASVQASDSDLVQVCRARMPQARLKIAVLLAWGPVVGYLLAEWLLWWLWEGAEERIPARHACCENQFCWVIAFAESWLLVLSDVCFCWSMIACAKWWLPLLYCGELLASWWSSSDSCRC